MEKKLTAQAVSDALRRNPSAEPDGENIVYYLHITDDGEIVDTVYDADASFTDIMDMAEYFGEHDTDDDWGQACADTEDDPRSEFPAVCQRLADMANNYLSQL